MNAQTVLIAFGLTLFAGLSTGIGSLLTLLTRRTNKRFMAVSLGFSAGFMIYVAMIDMFDLAKDVLTVELGKAQGTWLTVAAFFGGMLLIAVIDRLVPSVENPHELRQIEDMESCSTDDSGKPRALMRLGFMTALAIAIHNFPEGLATFASALHSLNLGIAIAVAIAIHNIPEGIAVAIPIYCATGSRRKAFLWSLLSGLSEPLGALIGFAILSTFGEQLDARLPLRPRGRYYGVHFARRTAAVGSRIWFAASRDLWPDWWYDDYGTQSSAVRINRMEQSPDRCGGDEYESTGICYSNRNGRRERSIPGGRCGTRGRSGRIFGEAGQSRTKTCRADAKGHLAGFRILCRRTSVILGPACLCRYGGFSPWAHELCRSLRRLPSAVASAAEYRPVYRLLRARPRFGDERMLSFPPDRETAIWPFSTNWRNFCAGRQNGWKRPSSVQAKNINDPFEIPVQDS